MLDQLRKLKENNVTNILALRGDKIPGEELSGKFKYASDLVKFIKDYDSSFNIVGACYPEGHCESSSIDEDIENLRYKIDAGVTHLITQLFFDNDHFYNFMEKLEAANINVPVEAGIMRLRISRRLSASWHVRRQHTKQVFNYDKQVQLR